MEISKEIPKTNKQTNKKTYPKNRATVFSGYTIP
jgi:hypothetical protein